MTLQSQGNGELSLALRLENSYFKDYKKMKPLVQLSIKTGIWGETSAC